MQIRLERRSTRAGPTCSGASYLPFFLSFVWVSAEAASVFACFGVAFPVERTFDAIFATFGDVRSFLGMGLVPRVAGRLGQLWGPGRTVLLTVRSCRVILPRASCLACAGERGVRSLARHGLDSVKARGPAPPRVLDVLEGPTRSERSRALAGCSSCLYNEHMPAENLRQPRQVILIPRVDATRHRVSAPVWC